MSLLHQGSQADEYNLAIGRAKGMLRDPDAQKLAGQRGMKLLDVTWEDTGRFKNSSVGPNISDMTIQVQHMQPGVKGFSLSCMPVIRYPNFTDLTADLAPDQFYVLVGNQSGTPLVKIALRELLEDPRKYMNRPTSWKGAGRSLLAPERDSHVLVGAQACLLPVPPGGMAEFNPVVFNYQSVPFDPAVLAILATREGTSMTVVDNQRDGFDAAALWGQRLFFNSNGRRASLTAGRRSDVAAEEAAAAGVPVTLHEGPDVVLLIQVPLKQKQVSARAVADTMSVSGAALRSALARSSDMEDAAIGHGAIEGPFTEFDDLEIERDPNFPVRVTVQFYKATSNGMLTEGDMADIAGQINRVYAQADYVGSLVVQGETARPTEHAGPHGQTPGWWQEFWRRHHKATGQSPEETMAMLEQLLGDGWRKRSPEEVEHLLEQAVKETRW